MSGMDGVAAALARTVKDRIAESRTTTQRGVVTAVGTDGTVTFTVGSLGSRIGMAVGAPPEVGDVIAYLDEGRGFPLVLGPVGRQPAPPEPRFYTGSVVGGTATSATAIITQNSILTAQRNLIMVVQVVGNCGNNGAPQTTGMAVWDEAGANIMLDTGVITASTLILRHFNTGDANTIAMTGRKAYTAGQTCGFRVVYSVDTSTISISVGATVTFYPDL